MDPITHVASGAVAMYALRERPRTAWGLPFGMVAAASPDVDIFFGSSAIDYLTIHRGITHSFAGGALLALLLALLFALPLRRAPQGWGFAKVWGVSYALVLVHIWLDAITTYGTQILQPFSDWRAALPGVYIIDPLLTLPLLAAVAGAAMWGRRGLAVAAVLWMFAYPLANVGTAKALEGVWSQRLASEGRPAVVHVIPDGFTPYYWKLVHDAGDNWRMARLTLFDDAPPAFETYAKANPGLWNRLEEQDELFRVYGWFAMFLTQETASPDGSLVAFRDLRFTTLVPFLRERLGRGTGTAFLLLARLGTDGRLEGVRFRGGSSSRDAKGGDGFRPPAGGVSPLPRVK